MGLTPTAVVRRTSVSRAIVLVRLLPQRQRPDLDAGDVFLVTSIAVAGGMIAC